MALSFNVTASERADIQAIAERAFKIAKKAGSKPDKLSFIMDVTAAHASGCPLDLARLRDADDFNLAHDVFGISRHIDRETGELTDCFSPRFTARVTSAA